jgi:chemotaxis protein methyltransferase CheR
MSDLLELGEEEFLRISTLIHTRFGIDLSKKQTLVRGRLNGTLRTLGYRSFSEYMHAVDSDTSGQRLLEMVDRLSTNHTYFYRESDHLEYLTSVALPTLWGENIQQGLADARIWCAGCATGEEPYSLIIAMADRFGLNSIPDHPVVLATDISTSALAVAKQGVYPLSRVREAGDIVSRGYATTDPDGQTRMSAALTRRVLFRRLNLMQSDFPFRRSFDVIFCRNVMIYFDQPTRVALVRAFWRYLRPGGFLFLGHSESMGRNVDGFQYLCPAVYRRVP